MYEKQPAGRFQTWMLESRTRYGLVQGGIGILIILGVGVVSGSLPSSRGLPFVIPAVLLSFLVHGWIWYPRAKRRLTRHG